jgi:wyosine [tRNA(Phe)-imidazoG37] synthetase (radical SAM superfamily)
MLLALKNSVTYGPVNSRRLGRSLGINLFPGERKVCTFDCLYCQYGRAKPVPETSLDMAAMPSIADVLCGLEDALASLDAPPAYLTLSGNGEPTLHPGFPEVVEGILAVRDRLVPAARTAILSNSTTVSRRYVREALERLDVRIMKLDAGDEETFRRFNGARPGLTLEEVLDGLRRLHEVTLQCLFAAGPGGNLAPRNVEAWVRAAASVNPLSVQLYTLDREAPSRRLYPAAVPELEGIRERLAALGVEAHVFQSVRRTAIAEAV